MKILCYSEFQLKPDHKFSIEYVYEEDVFYEKILNKKYDVIIISFNFFPHLMEIKRYIDSKIIFLCDYCDDFIYKKILEVADYCYMNYEVQKLNIRLEYLRKKITHLSSGIYKNKNLLYNFFTDELYIDSMPAKISAAEKELLKTLIKNRNRYISKENILMECESIDSESSIKVLISHLRKLGFDIINQKNSGYKLGSEQ